MDSGVPTPGCEGKHREDRWRLATASLRFEPAYLIVGAMKAGTTFLHEYLVQHPSCAAPAEKELHFFDNNFERGTRWYRSRFPIRPWMQTRRGRRMISGEASPYYFFHPLAAARAREVCPRARIIVLLRDPVDRAYSHYKQNVRAGFESLSFADALHAEAGRLAGEEARLIAQPGYYSSAHQTHSYMARGDYAPQLTRWFDAFGRSNVLVLQSERLWEKPAMVYAKVVSFLGLPGYVPAGFRPRNRVRYDAMPPETIDRLTARFGPSNERLFDLLGERFAWKGVGRADAVPATN